MFKKTLSLCALVALTATMGFAQSTETSTTKTEKQAPFSAEEEEAFRSRIESFEKKITANKDNENIDYEAELYRLNEMKARFNERATNKIEIDEKK